MYTRRRYLRIRVVPVVGVLVAGEAHHVAHEQQVGRLVRGEVLLRLLVVHRPVAC